METYKSQVYFSILENHHFQFTRNCYGNAADDDEVGLFSIKIGA